ncbi:MAG: hypothetical protein QXP53_00745 [Candidatus Pacearchaeota archaeon]
MKTKTIKIFLTIALIFVVFSLFLCISSLASREGRSLTDHLSVLTEKKSPSDRITENQIQVLEDKVIIYLDNPVLVTYSDTNSMDPTLDNTANGIEIKPANSKEIHVGDIISYKSGEEIISHRVTAIGYDSDGWFCKTKGDNAQFSDSKVRFSQIVGLLVVIVY